MSAGTVVLYGITPAFQRFFTEAAEGWDLVFRQSGDTRALPAGKCVLGGYDGGGDDVREMLRAGSRPFAVVLSDAIRTRPEVLDDPALRDKMVGPFLDTYRRAMKNEGFLLVSCSAFKREGFNDSLLSVVMALGNGDFFKFYGFGKPAGTKGSPYGVVTPPPGEGNVAAYLYPGDTFIDDQDQLAVALPRLVRDICNPGKVLSEGGSSSYGPALAAVGGVALLAFLKARR